MGRRIDIIFVAPMALAAAFTAHAGEIGHFNGGVMNMRDYHPAGPRVLQRPLHLLLHDRRAQ